MTATASDYSTRAREHMPQDQQRLTAEVRRLATEQHLSAMDIATALRLDLAQVREMLAARTEEAAAIHLEHANSKRSA